MRTTKVLMQGGIGNQLFCLYAGRFVALNSNSKLELDLGQLGNAATPRSFELGALEFPFAFTLKNHQPHELHNLILKILKRLGYLAKFVNYYSSPVVGFDRNLLTNKKSLILNGYFQTYEYVSRVLENEKHVPLFELKNPGTAYRELEKRIFELNPVVMHIRRGDYLESKNMKTIGVLSDDYFLRILQIHYPMRPVWVFSNDSNLTRFFDTPNLEVITSGDLTDLEELILMSKASDLIISNSTFSWWSGFLSNGSVVAPAKWFRGLEDPENLYPCSWLRVDPDWI